MQTEVYFYVCAELALHKLCEDFLIFKKRCQLIKYVTLAHLRSER